MDKARRAFQFHLNPARERDQEIILWLGGIPRRQRMRRVKEVLLKAIHEGLSPQPMVKLKGVFLRLYLYPGSEQDQRIVAWLETVPKTQRSRKVKTILHQVIAKVHSQKPAPKSSDPDTITVARGLFSSFRKKQSSES